MLGSKKSDPFLFQFAVIADSHIRLPGTTSEGGYASNQFANQRAKYVVECVNHLQPSFVVHLGDMVHPIPALQSYGEALKIARKIFSSVDAKFYVLPGNHDIGDKPNAWLPAPVVEEDSHLKFSKSWGAPYQSFSFENCFFVCLDTPILNSGFERERQQLLWLENELRMAKENGLRIFIFMHYPLFICDPVEPTHYDNIDEPARSWLLDLFARHDVEAVFSGHVHNIFVGFHNHTFYYSVPSMTFVRPEYSELAAVSPGDEFGRNDTGKLGFFLVRVYPEGHEILPVRTYGEGKLASKMPIMEPCQTVGKTFHMLGATLRQGWGRRVELATDGLDEFTRKEAYQDGLLLALIELGVISLRVPFADLANADVRQRLSDFAQMGFEFTVYSLGEPDESTLAVVEAHGKLLLNWEIIFPEYTISRIGIAINKAKNVFGGQLFIAPVVPIKEDDGDRITFQHFASHGFSIGQMDKVEKWLSMLGDQAGEVGLTFRVSPWESPEPALLTIDQWQKTPKLVNLQFPRLDEGVRFKDDGKLQAFVINAWKASQTMTNTTVFMDTFVDSDRGYYPRIGLVDRRYNPRPAFYALKLAALKT